MPATKQIQRSLNFGQLTWQFAQSKTSISLVDPLQPPHPYIIAATSTADGGDDVVAIAKKMEQHKTKQQ